MAREVIYDKQVCTAARGAHLGRLGRVGGRLGRAGAGWGGSGQAGAGRGQAGAGWTLRQVRLPSSPSGATLLPRRPPRASARHRWRSVASGQAAPSDTDHVRKSVILV